MRLTLRTLLAYVDGVLGPTEHADLHRRIQQSEDVSNLLRRVKRLQTQAELQTPPLTGKGLGGDPNAIAEYLDDVLPGGQVPELERICLESDIQLSELAHCHRLLSTAFQTKVVVPDPLHATAIELVDPARRGVIEGSLLTRNTKRTKRRRGMLVRVDDGRVATPTDASELEVVDAGGAAVDIQVPMVASGGESIRPEGLDLEYSKLAREVPEYLMGKTTGAWTMPLAIFLLAGLLGIVVWQSLGPWARVQELFRVAPAIARNDQPTPSKLPGDSVATEANTPSGAADQAGEGGTESVQKEAAPSGAEITPGDIDVEAAADNGSLNQENIEVNAGLQTPPIPSGAPPTASDGAVDGVEPVEVDVAGIAPPLHNDRGTQSVQWNPLAPNEALAVVLVEAGGVWKRAAPEQPIDSQSAIVIPPASRTTIGLPRGHSWLACGPTQMRIDDQPQTSAIHVRVGQAMLTCQGVEPVQLHTPAGNCLLTTADPHSIIAIEAAFRPQGAGAVVDRRAWAPILVIIAIEGTVTVTNLPDATATFSTKLEVGEGWAVLDSVPQNRFGVLGIPDWLRTSLVRPTDGPAAEDLQHLIDQADLQQRDMVDTLDAVALHRRPETAALAIKTAMLVGHWQPFATQLLGADRFRSHWEATLDLARQILASDPTAADALHAELVTAYNEVEADALLQLLSGPTEDQLQTAGLGALVAELDSTQLPRRVLAAYQLLQLTGKSFGFQAHAPSRASIQQWRRESASKRSILLEVRDPIWERSPAP